MVRTQSEAIQSVCSGEADCEDQISGLYEFLKDFPEETHSALLRIAKGQISAQKAYAIIKDIHGYDPREVQRPILAFSGDVAPSSHPLFALGSARLGEMLISRTPGSVWIGQDGRIVSGIRALGALAVSKGISHLVYMKTSASDLLNVVYDFYSQPESLRDFTRYSPTLAAYIRKNKFLFDRVAKVGLARYEAAGISFNGSADENYVLAMAAQRLMDGVRQAELENVEMPEIVPLLQDAVCRKHYFWNRKKKVFTSIPLLNNDFDKGQTDDQALLRKRVIRDFLASLPYDENNPENRKAWEDVGGRLLAGYANYIQECDDFDALRAKLGEKKLNDLVIYFSGCADSRLMSKFILGPAPSLMLLYEMRLVGGMLATPQGHYSDEAQLFEEFAAAIDKGIIVSHHSKCGAMQAIERYNDDPQGQGKLLPLAFQEMGRDRRGLYQQVHSWGQTHAQTMDHYREVTGIKPSEISDCHGLQQIRNEMQASRKSGVNARNLYLFADVATCTLYVNVPGTNRFSKIPQLQPRVLEFCASDVGDVTREQVVAVRPQGEALVSCHV